MNQLFKNKKLIIIISSFLAITLLLGFNYLRQKPLSIDLALYESLLQSGDIQKAVIKDNKIILYANSGQYSIVKDGVDIKKLLRKVPIEITDNDEFQDMDIMLLFVLFFGFVLLLFAKKKEATQPTAQERKEQAYELETFGSSRITPAISHTNFKDIAGIDGVKEELTEIVDFLKNPKRYKAYGINLPKGVLLVGPPGVGKTMVAKAIAGEANVPFFYQSGASFVQIYVGMGAKRVRELFSKAKTFSPSIVFIDEIDAVGKMRGGMRNDERETTLNQLLTEIDGFEDSSGVIVIGATNKMEMIDEALLRSGRFDRRIFLSLPDLKDRVQILKIYLDNKPFYGDVDQIAHMSVGFSGAALSTFVNEAAINALRRDSKIIEIEDFLAVRDKVLLGKRKVLSFSDAEKEIQATYQAAKALSAFWFEVDFDKMMILNGGIKEVDREIESKTQMLAKIKVYLSGIVASNIIYNETFSNAKDDLVKARELAEKMAGQYGMGNSLIPTSSDINTILENAKDEVYTFLAGMKKPLETIKNKLLQDESITKEELKNVIENTF